MIIRVMYGKNEISQVHVLINTVYIRVLYRQIKIYQDRILKKEILLSGSCTGRTRTMPRLQVMERFIVERFIVERFIMERFIVERFIVER